MDAFAINSFALIFFVVSQLTYPAEFEQNIGLLQWGSRFGNFLSLRFLSICEEIDSVTCMARWIFTFLVAKVWIMTCEIM